MKKILIIGGGKLGQAIAKVLGGEIWLRHDEAPKSEVWFWDVDPTLRNIDDLYEYVKKADFIFLCVPTAVIPIVLNDIKASLNQSVILIGASKGIDQKTGKFAHELFAENLPLEQGFVFLLGPMLASELVVDLPGGAVCAGNKIVAIEEVVLLFDKTKLLVKPHDDLRGASVCSVLKNIYAIASGVVHDYGMNARGMLLTKAVEESQYIVEVLGGNSHTVLSLAGLGDLITTGSCELSRNFSYGKSRAGGDVCDFESEGSVSIETFANLLKEKGELPLLFSATLSVVRGEVDSKEKVLRAIGIKD